MTILAKVKRAGLNPLAVKVITVTVLNKPASYFGTQRRVLAEPRSERALQSSPRGAVSSSFSWRLAGACREPFFILTHLRQFVKGKIAQNFNQN